MLAALEDLSFMSDLSLPPLTLVPLEETGTPAPAAKPAAAPAPPAQPVPDCMADTLPLPLHEAAEAPAKAKPAAASYEPFRWPTPPYPMYGAPERQTRPEPCEVQGVNGSVVSGQMMSINPEVGIAQVRLSSARGAVSLRFAQFRRMTLTQAFKPQSASETSIPGARAGLPGAADYRVQMANGALLNGKSVGHVETAHGLFLFPPLDEQGTVQRVFVPRDAYRSVESGAQALQPPRAEPAEKEQQQQQREQKLGDMLVPDQITTPEQLLAAIEQQARMPMVRIGEALVALKLITQAQLSEALESQKADRSVPLGEMLVRKGLVSRQDLQSALARKMGYPVVDVNTFPAEPDAVRKVPFAVATRLNVLPLLLRGVRLVVAMEDPSKRPVVEELEFVSQSKVVPVLATAGQLFMALGPTYEKAGADTSRREGDTGTGEEAEDANKLLESLEQQQASNEQDEPADTQIEQSDNSLVRLINSIIIDAASQRVSDIHIETQPGREKVKVRFRKDGVMKPYLELPYTYRSALVARLKIMCDLDISERRKPQDGKINFSKFSAQHKLELRVATIPTANGLEDVVMRLLASAKPLPMDQIGLAPNNLERLKEAVARPYGMVLCVGPTGSGKTTTLHSALGYINRPERKIWTAEDPVEITQAGLRQVQVNPKIDWTFAKALRAFLRADPDVIMVGEIRDEETAKTAVEASLTGHLVLSTLHTNSAPETVTRLLDMGMDPFNFGDSLLAVLAQRLVRRVCAKCRVTRDATPAEVDELVNDWLHVFQAEAKPDKDGVLKEWFERFGSNGKLQHYHAPGCPNCEGTGFRGRAGLHELLTMSRELRHLIQTGGRVEQMQAVGLREGMRTLRQDGIEKVLQGITTIEEVRATSNA
jgi:type II secretory ATPase GspE/PulE/Tfp pilus assembly ATPase PilB-like protein